MGTRGHIDVHNRYNFHVLIDGIYVAGFHRATNIGLEIEEKEYREGNSPVATRRLRRFAKCKDITLETGVTIDESFFWWSLNCADYHYGDRVRRNATIQTLDRNGSVVKERNFQNCWVKEWHAGDFDAMANEALIEKMVLAPEYMRL